MGSAVQKFSAMIYDLPSHHQKLHWSSMIWIRREDPPVLYHQGHHFPSLLSPAITVSQSSAFYISPYQPWEVLSHTLIFFSLTPLPPKPTLPHTTPSSFCVARSCITWNSNAKENIGIQGRDVPSTAKIKPATQDMPKHIWGLLRKMISWTI